MQAASSKLNFNNNSSHSSSQTAVVVVSVATYKYMILLMTMPCSNWLSMSKSAAHSVRQADQYLPTKSVPHRNAFASGAYPDDCSQFNVWGEWYKIIPLR